MFQQSKGWGAPPDAPFLSSNQGSTASQSHGAALVGQDDVDRHMTNGASGGGRSSGSGNMSGIGSSSDHRLHMDGSVRKDSQDLDLGMDVKVGIPSTKRRRGSEGTSVDPEDDKERPLAITCAPCRTRKIKCDSKKPSCDNCFKDPAGCYYPVKQKPGLRAGTGGDVSKRLEQLEERVSAYESRLAEQERQLLQMQASAWRDITDGSGNDHPSSMMRDGADSSAFLTDNGHQGQGQGQGQGPSISVHALDIMSDPMGRTSSFAVDHMGGPGDSGAGGISLDMLSRDPHANGNALSGNTHGFGASANTFSAGAKINMGMGGGTDMFPLAGPSASPSGFSIRSFSDPRVLPSDDIVRDLIQLYFRHIHPWAPILTPSDLGHGAPWDIVVHALVVVTLRFSTDPRVANTKEQYRTAAKTHVLAHAIESTSLSSVQALALLALDLIGSEQGPSSWGILALLTRSAVHLGLAREDDTTASALAAGINTRLGFAPPAPSLSRTSIIPPPANWHEDESRRRLFWLIFCLDRYACVSTGWDFALPDFEIKRRLPCADEIWSRQDWYYTPLFRPVLHRDLTPDFSVLSPMSSLVEALDLLGRAHTLQSQTIEPGDARAVETRKDATMTLSSATRRWFGERSWTSDGIGLTIQAIHHATLLKLNAYYAFPALTNGDPQEPYTSTCMASCRAMVHLTDSARLLGWQDAASPLFVWGCWVAARVLFVHAFQAHQMGPDAEFEAVLRGLKEMAQYWGLANQYVKLLERAKRKWLASTNPSTGGTAAGAAGGAVGGPPSASPGTGTGSNSNALPDAIHVLLDLRRTAYSAVNTNVDETPQVSPPDLHLGGLPAWAVQPLLGDLHSWFDLPAGLFQADF